MPMKMGWRWYGEGNDPVTLSDIKQIPGVTSIVWALHNKMPGEIWEIDEIQKVADQIHAYGFDMDVVESVNVHDDIKIGLPTRDQYIENYKQCIRNLSKFGVKVICYNFMPIFDWTRTDPVSYTPLDVYKRQTPTCPIPLSLLRCWTPPTRSPASRWRTQLTCSTAAWLPPRRRMGSA